MNLNPSPASNTSGNDATTHHGCFSKNTGIDTFIIIFRVRNWNPALAGEQFQSEPQIRPIRLIDQKMKKHPIIDNIL